MPTGAGCDIRSSLREHPGKRFEVRRYLAMHQYRTASVTMSFGDYLWNEPYARCVVKGDTNAIASLEQSYLQAAQEEAQYELHLPQILYGHKFPLCFCCISELSMRGCCLGCWRDTRISVSGLSLSSQPKTSPFT